MAGLLGIKLADAQKSVDLFTWFCFEKVDEPPTDAGALVFRPNGPAFRRLVKLELSLDSGEVITAASLHVLREFIETNSANAGDLVKSFIRYGDGESLGYISEQFMAGALQRSRQPVITRGGGPEVDRDSPLAFRVFTGEMQQAVAYNLAFENRRENGVPTFVLSLKGDAAAQPKSWLARLLGR